MHYFTAIRALICFVASNLIGALIFAAFGGLREQPIAPVPIPVVRVSSAIALEICNHIEFVVVAKSNGDTTLLLDPAREAIELLDKTISDPKRKQVVHMQCPHSSNTI